MEIKIREISDTAVSKIDEIAAKQHKSRNQYLKEQIELLALEPELIQKDNTYEKIVSIVLKQLEENESLLREVTDKLMKGDRQWQSDKRILD